MIRFWGQPLIAGTLLVGCNGKPAGPGTATMASDRPVKAPMARRRPSARFSRAAAFGSMPFSRRTLMWKYLTAATALLLLAGTAHAGVVVHMQNRNPSAPDAKAADHQVIYAQDGMLRIDELDDQGHIRRMQLVRDGVIWVVEVPERTYSRFDKAAIQAKMGGMNDRMEAMLQRLPPEQRARAEQNIKNMQQRSQDWTVKDTGRGEKGGTYSCDVWQVLRNTQVISENCVAPTSSLPGGAELVSAVHKAAAVAEDVISAAPQFSHSMAKASFAMWGKLDGFPVLTRAVSGGKATNEMFVSNIEQHALPADKFAIPAGFTEEPLGGPGAN
jgi:hypothetical protein